MTTIEEHSLDTDDVESHLHEIEDLLVHQDDDADAASLQDTSRSGQAETLVSKQNIVELESRLAALDSRYLAYILEATAEEDRRLLWRLIDATRRDAILTELSEDTRASLVTTVSQPNPRKMPNVFELQGGRLRQISVDNREDLARANLVWIDLVAPTEDERALIEEMFGLSLPMPEEHTDLEASARFYVEEDGSIYLHSDFLLDKKDESRNVPVTFVLHRNILFSVRNEELPVFRLQRLRARTQVGAVSDSLDVLLDLYAADVEYSADALEDIYAGLETVSKRVLSTEMTDTQAAKVLAAIASEEDLNGRIRRNVLDTRRAVSFLMRGRFLSANQIADTQQLLRDIESLDGHTWVSSTSIRTRWCGFSPWLPWPCCHRR